MNGKALAVIIAAIVLVVGGIVAAVAVASGGDDDDSADDDNDSSDTSGDASIEEFCAPYQDYMDSFLDVDFTAPEDQQVQSMVQAIKDYAAALDDLGAPDDMPDEAREGMEFLVDWADDLDPEDFTTIEDFENFDDEFSEDEDAAGEAFFAYVEETCGDTATELPTDLPTDLPTELPTDLPTDFPTELPSDYLTMLPSDFMTMLPSEYLTMMPSDFMTMFPSEFPTP